MITVCTNDRCYEFRGLSSDTKPTEKIGNGSIFLECDTCKVFVFDEEHKVWLELK